METLNQTYFSRHSDIVQPKVGKITIVGAGGIGSVTTLALAKMGFSDLEVYDFDDVSEVNIGSQMYRIKDIGRKKVEALAEQVEEYSGVKISPKAEKTDGKGLISDILILAVDNITARGEIAKNAIFGHLVDGRMGGQTFSVYTFPFDEKDLYLSEHIFPESEGSELPCTAKAISFNTFGIASFIANEVKKINNGETIIKEQHYCYVNRILDI